MATLQVMLLGRFEVLRGESGPVKIPALKAKAMLAYLALRPGHADSRERVATLLWEDSAERQARASLRQTLSQLRKALNRAGEGALIARGETLCLDAAMFDFDVWRFERLVARGTPDALEEAAALYNGGFLEDVAVDASAYEEWSAVERARLRETVQGVLSHLLDHYKTTGDIERGIQTGRRLLALDPLQENVHRALIRFYLGQERRGAALDQYHECREVLRRELGVEPSAETQRIYNDVVRDDPAPPTPLAPTTTPTRPSIAVLPFNNMSGDPEQEYFSDGITEDIITELSRFHSLFVIARNSSFTFKGRAIDVTEVGRILGVRYVVEGSVRKAGNRVRIAAQLVEAATGNHLWAERYDRDLDDIFVVQDEVTNAIVAAIEPTLGSVERERAHRKPTGRLDAWENYQRGLLNMYRFASQENTEAQSFFRRAIEIDPSFAAAHAGLAHALYVAVLFGYGAESVSALGEARDAAQRAIMLDGDDSLAHSVVGRVHVMQGEHDAAIFACRTALALNLNLANARYGLGWALTYSGRYEEGIAEVDEAIRLSPRDPLMSGFLSVKAAAYIAMERYEEALKSARAALRQPNPVIWAYVAETVALAQLDRIEEARQALERVRAIKPDFDLNFVAGVIKRMRGVGFEFYLEGLKKAVLEK